MAYHVQVVRDSAAFQALAGDWTRLLAASPPATVFASFEWNATWWEHFGAGAGLYLLAVADDSGEFVGLAPLMRRQAGVVRKLEFLGTGLSDVGDFLLHPTHAAAATQAILDHLAATQHEWDLLDLDEIPTYSLLAPTQPGLDSAGLRANWLDRSDNPFIVLPSSWAAYMAALPRRWRAGFERRLRRMSEVAGVAVEVITSGDQVPPAVATLYRLHLARWAVKDDALEAVHRAPNFGAFLEQVSTQLAARGWLRLIELRSGDDVIASSLCFLVNGHWNGYLKGFDPRWADHSPGQVLDLYTLRQACGEPVREFDLGRGSEDYKYRFGATNRKNRRLVLASSTPRSSVGLALTTLRVRGRALLNAAQAPHREATTETRRPGVSDHDG